MKYPHFSCMMTFYDLKIAQKKFPLSDGDGARLVAPGMSGNQHKRILAAVAFTVTANNSHKFTFRNNNNNNKIIIIIIIVIIILSI